MSTFLMMTYVERQYPDKWTDAQNREFVVIPYIQDHHHPDGVFSLKESQFRERLQRRWHITDIDNAVIFVPHMWGTARSGNHWVLYVIVGMRQAYGMNSLSLSKKDSKLDQTNLWKKRPYKTIATPQQKDVTSCGVHVVLAMRILAESTDIDWDHEPVKKIEDRLKSAIHSDAVRDTREWLRNVLLR